MISFNNIPNTTRTPGNYNEIDNSRALKGLVANPHKVLNLYQYNMMPMNMSTQHHLDRLHSR